MSKLEELIQKYCPDGVEYHKIKEVYKRVKGTPITAGKMKEIATPDGSVRIFAGGKTVIDANEEDIPNANITRVPAVLVQSRGVIDAVYYDKPFTFKNEMWAYTTSNPKSVKYLYYVLKNNIQVFRDAASGMGSLPQISLGVTEDFEIPIPPLPVQEEIVRVLDTFTELQAELQAELQKRLQQYEYYRDNLIQKHCVGVEYKPLCELGTFYSGLTGKSKDDFSGGNAKFITYVNIFNHPSLETDVEEKVKIAEGEKQNTVQYGDMLFTGSSETPDECGMCSVLTHHTDEEMYLNSFCFGFRFNDLNDKSPDFMKHLFRSTDIRKKICKTANGVTRFNISKKEFAKIEIPLLPLDVQVKLAAILDRFFTLTTDLTAGLPAEIEKRKQQYEYYRDKLLTFKRITK
jgi:type I restriction enzyme S subunit